MDYTEEEVKLNDLVFDVLQETRPQDKLSQEERDIINSFMEAFIGSTPKARTLPEKEYEELTDKFLTVLDRLVYLYRNESDTAGYLYEYKEREGIIWAGTTGKSLLRTGASQLGRDKNLPAMIEPNVNIENVFRKAIPKVPCDRGLYLLNLWIEAEGKGNLDKEGRYVIEKGTISQLARDMKTYPKELKIDFLYLGAVNYSVVCRIAEQHTAVKFKKFFDVEFHYDIPEEEVNRRLNDRTKYKIYGTRILHFIGDTPIREIKFKPEDWILNEVKKIPEKGYIGKIGFSDKLLEYLKTLNNFESKMLYLIGGCKKSSKIHFNVLKKERYLNIEELIKKKGKGTVKQMIGDTMDKFVKDNIIEEGYTFIKGSLIWTAKDHVFIYPNGKRRVQVKG